MLRCLFSAPKGQRKIARGFQPLGPECERGPGAGSPWPLTIAPVGAGKTAQHQNAPPRALPNPFRHKGYGMARGLHQIDRIEVCSFHPKDGQRRGEPPMSRRDEADNEPTWHNLADPEAIRGRLRRGPRGPVH